MKDLPTPSWINFLIENLAPGYVEEEIRGDLDELFLNDLETKGIAYAQRKYVFNGLGFLAKSFFWKKSSTTSSTFMIRNYFKMASRSLAAHKSTTAINILGLVIGIASALVLITVIQFELSFDKFHSNTDQIYRLVRVGGSEMSEFRTGISYPVPGVMKSEISQIQSLTSMEYFGGANVDVLDASGGSVAKFREESGCVLIQPEFFDVFDFKDSDFKWLSGNPHKALVDPFSVVLTKTMARKYFGDENSFGRTIRLQNKMDFKVTGVVEDFPANTDFPFQVLLSYSTLKAMEGDERMNDWFSVNDSHCTYLTIPATISSGELESLIDKVHASHTPEDLHKFRHYRLQRFEDVHFDARFGTFSRRTISRETIMALGIIAAFLLLTGSINYINLSTAQSTLRAKEIGLRKVMGSDRKNLMLQCLTETFIVVAVAGAIALGLAAILVNSLGSLVNLPVDHYHSFPDQFILLCLACIVVILSFLAGLYPSIIISRFNPITALKNKFSTETLGGLSLRKILVVVQFTITQMLVVGTFIVVSQMRFFQNVDMGFNRNALVITARVPDRNAEKLNVLEDQLRAKSFIADVSFSYSLPSGVARGRSYQDIGKPEAKEASDHTVYEYASIDSHYLPLYGIKVAAGRDLIDKDSAGNILINKTLAKNLGLGSPAEAVGEVLKTGDGKMVTVVGVVEDYYSNSLKEGVDNIVFFHHEKDYSTMSIKLDMKNGTSALPDRIKEIEQLWTSTFPDFVFNYQFFDENIDAFYQQEEKYAKLFQLFSGVFLLIGCLGLYGLITFVTNRKGKEVAIRKVMGATTANILTLFSKEYVQLILMSFALAVPVTYYAISSWLDNFANKIQLQWWLFIVPGFFVLLVALLVVSTKSFKSANANPVDRLKYE